MSYQSIHYDKKDKFKSKVTIQWVLKTVENQTDINFVIYK